MSKSAIAIVGMAGRFPGARTIADFWENLRGGVESIRELSDAELLAAGASPKDLANPDYVRSAAILADVDQFDASFFGFSQRDAAIMDPQHRHFLECAWEAVENSGHVPDHFPGSIGVFAGSGMNAYMIHNLLANRALAESAGLFLIRQTGNDKDVLATRVSYQLNLRGPSISVQTACSTSLVAVHLACQSLLNCECDMALAGGVTIEIPHARGYIYREGEILSRDGHCRSFDAASSGTIFSSGVGLVVLRRLEDALADGDSIRAVILGSAINNDGARKIGYLAPSVEGQAEVIAEALGVAGLSADDISYIETHGTGTSVGDPIEIKALAQAFRRSSQRKGFCAIGSLKSSLGHMDAAAGVGGLIKTVLALENKKIPASLHFENPNPLIDFANSPFYVNTQLADWTSTAPRRAGVTSLGIGGTNAHVILEEPHAAKPSASAKPFQLLTISAKTETALARAAENLAAHLENHPDQNFADVAFTSQIGRKEFAHRRALAATNAADAVAALRGGDPKRVSAGVASAAAPSMVFLFSGQGSQYVNMGADLYRTEPVFRSVLERCAEILRPHLGLDLRELIYPAPGAEAAAAERLNQTCIAQPALFAIEYSLAQWWIAAGVKPQAMIGHSIGEYVAACLAGVFSLEEGLAISAARGRMMQEMAPGAMLSVPLPADEIEIGESLAVAAMNAPRQTVISGPIPVIEELENRLTAREIACRRLHTSHAFHSPMMDPMLERFREQMRGIALRPPAIPFVSNLTGTWITPEQATDPAYWTAHLRNAVRFSDCLREALRQTGRLLLEVGPGQALASLARQHPDRKSTPVFSSLRHPQEKISDAQFLVASVGQLWAAGQSIDWRALHGGESRRRVPLPAYPFEHQRFWIDPDPNPRAEEAQAERAPRSMPPGAELADATDTWFQRRAWLRTALPAVPAADAAPGAPWLVFADDSALSKNLLAQLKAVGRRPIRVAPGKSYARRGDDEYAIRPGIRADYDQLLGDLASQGVSPRKIAHLWSLRASSSRISPDHSLDRAFYSLLFLIQAMGDQDWTSFDLAVISNGLHSIPGDAPAREGGDPVRAALLGPVKVAPKEFPGITCRNIDFPSNVNGDPGAAARIIAELSSGSAESVIAWRGDDRWVESFETAAPSAPGKLKLREHGVYLITGGFGGIGLAIAEHLAREWKARLVLVGRTALPAAKDWTAMLRNGAPEKTKRQLAKLLEIQAAGGEILTVQADVTRKEEVELALREAQRKFGTIHGVIHAAGVIEDAPLQTKTRESAARVLGPKVQGTLVLKDALRGIPLDFLALFSSVSSLAPPPGQVDYAAANAVLDAIAFSGPNSPVIAINWGLWQGIGMGAGTVAHHPLLDRRIAESREETIYAARLDCDRDWVLGEHRLKQGPALLPGTGYLEMGAAALRGGSFGKGFQFEDVFFLSPLSCAPGSTKEIRVRLRRERAATRFSVLSKEAGWVENASGQIAERSAPQPENRNLAEILSRCRAREVHFDNARRTRQEQYFNFGPRWRNLRALHLGSGQAIADLELAADFHGDIAQYLLHPALLDLATGSALYLIPDYEATDSLYLPLSYKKLTLFRPLPAKFHSHIRARSRNTAQGAIAGFDVTLLDPHGAVLAEIEEFSMRRLADPVAAAAKASQAVVSARSPEMASLEAPGIPASQGVRAFVRAVSGAFGREVIVTPEPLTAATNAAPSSSAEKQSREPATRDEVEEVLAGWWRELLGAEKIAPDDDFFDLGGHSLVAVRLFSKIKKNYRLDLSLSTLFEARTIRQLSKLIRQVGTPEVEARSWSPVVSIQKQGARPPLFVISGLGGNVLNFNRLASHLGQEQPVYALQPQGLDGRKPFLTRVEDMAAFYIREIRAIQPEGPYHLAGYSFGGFVAFEMAQQLCAAGEKVGLLGLLDTIEWHYLEQIKQSLRPKEQLALYKARFDQIFFEEGGATYLKDRLRTVSSRFIYRFFRALGRPLPQSVGTIQDINSFAAGIYKPRVYPGVLTIFRSTTREMLDGSDELLGWRGLAARGIEVRDVPGTHHNMTREPNVRVLAAKMRECLDGFSISADSPATVPLETRLPTLH